MTAPCGFRTAGRFCCAVLLCLIPEEEFLFRVIFEGDECAPHAFLKAPALRPCDVYLICAAAVCLYDAGAHGEEDKGEYQPFFDVEALNARAAYKEAAFAEFAVDLNEAVVNEQDHADVKQEQPG